ncbi:MAG TPA: tetratricopeptide repeat protein [Gammaproteobacteria bacterium]|jgi:predicted CXXCH cytochrome family protein
MLAKQQSANGRGLFSRAWLLIPLSGLAACGPPQQPEATAVVEAEASYVGGESCAGCHREQTELWLGSHHDLAMQAATEATVLGDFDGATLRHGDVTTQFLRRDGEFVISTDGPDGEPTEFSVSYVFGVDPLQQYLLELGDGKIQALSIAWDSRPEADGGQRWFHLYPDENIDYLDPLHWTGVFQRWNTMCADCHSTNLEKRFDFAADEFATRWSSIDVDCEACHGPGSVHAANPQVPPPALPARDHGWVFTAGARIASREPAATGAQQVEVCAQCHSLRTQLTDAHEPGQPLLDGYRPSLLEEGNYHADGQILGEVYVYGSFMQSAMAAAGVTCSDCHEPHSARLRAEGNAVCAQCHLATAYDQPGHHRHEPQSEAARCVSCHMRAETYMVVDPRRDHSFRVPRPGLSATLGAPNACTDCHSEESSAWAASRVAEWFPDGRWNAPHFGEALQAGRNWAADNHLQLSALVADTSQPAIARATALSLLARQLSPADSGLIGTSLDDASPIVRLAALDASAALAPAPRIDLAQRFLTDELLALRTAAARALLPARSQLSPGRQADLDAALAEYLSIQTFNSDRAQGALNSAAVAADLGQFDAAERLLLAAIERHPAETALSVNLAEIYRNRARADDAEAVLREALAAHPEDPALLLSLGFALVRTERADEALGHFEQAAASADGDPYYPYVLAIALNDAGESERAIELLRGVHDRFPGHVDALFALATMLRDTGSAREAYDYAVALSEIRPGAADAISLLRELEQGL